jgi:hypothetical protein
VTHPSEDHKGRDVDSNVQVDERCDVGNIGVVELLKDLDGPERDSVIWEVLPLVPHFKEEKDYQCKMKNLLVAEAPLALNDLPDYTLKTVPKNVLEVIPVGLAKFSEDLETRWDASTTLRSIALKPIKT